VLSALTMEGTTALLPGFLTGTLGAAPVVLGLVEAAGHGVGGLARLGGAELAAQPRRRRVVSLIGHTGVATCSALTGLAVAVWQVGALRTGAYAARGLRSPLRPAQAIEHAEPARLGRAVGVERGVDALGIALGPLLALVLLEVVSVRATLVLMIVPGLLAVVVALAARRATGAHARPRLWVRTSGVTSGPLGWLLLGVAAFELSNIAVALVLLRAGKLLAAGSGPLDGAQLVALLYLLYQLAVAAAAAPAGALADRLGSGSIIAAGALALLVARGAVDPDLAGGRPAVLGAAVVLALRARAPVRAEHLSDGTAAT
jgi:MFS family permease